MTPEIFKDRSSGFHLEEYKALRAEVLQLLETLRSLERNVVVAVGVFWAFLIKESDKTPMWAWAVPVLFAGLGMWRASGILKFFGQFRDYLSELEEAFHSAQGPEGWQHFTASQREKISRNNEDELNRKYLTGRWPFGAFC